jgi:hypothetical protein
MIAIANATVLHRIVGWDRHESNPPETGLSVTITFSADHGQTGHNLGGTIGLDDDLAPVFRRFDVNDLDLDVETARRLLMLACDVVWNALMIDGAAMAETKFKGTRRWLFDQVYRGEATRLMRTVERHLAAVQP